MKKLLSIFSAAVLSAVLSSGVSQAISYTEVGDASNLFSGAQLVPNDVSQINGSIGLGDKGDMYKLNFGGSSPFTLTLDFVDLGLLSLFADPQMFLFDGLGHGITSDNDSGSGDNARIIWTVAPGTYYVGLGDAAMRAFGTGANWNIGSSLPGSFGTVTKIENTSGIFPFNYALYMTPDTSALTTPPSASVPEPTSMALLGLGLLGLAWGRRNKDVA